MFRKTYLLMFLLFFLASDSALGWHRRCCRRCLQCPCPVKEPVAANYCLRDKYMDFPGTTDLYFCLAYDNGCPNDEYEDLWFGIRDTGLSYPQKCYQCESGSRAGKVRFGGGHGQNFPNLLAACEWLKVNYPGTLPSDWECKYYKFTYNGSWVYAVIEPAPNTHGAKYFGLETDEFSGENPIEISPNIKPNKPGSVLAIKYNDGGPRKALIWRK